MGESVLNAPAAAPGFPRRAGVLRCEGVDLRDVARDVGTPAFVYSAGAIREQYRRLDAALAGVPHRLFFSVKANSSLAVLSLLRELGAGVDVVSGGELYRALRAGFGGRDVVFSGVGKTDPELREALTASVRLVNVESEGELRRLDAIARGLGRRADIALRVNPEVTVATPHPYTQTGDRGHKFGIPWDEAVSVGRLALAMPNVRLAGLDMHIGSQIVDVRPYGEGLDRLLRLVDELRGAGAAELTSIDIGGGFGVAYAPGDLETPVEEFGRQVVTTVAPTGLELLVEPGRFVVGNAGVLLTRVLDRKRSGGRELVITDAGMTELLRPSHYGAYHQIEAVEARAERATLDVVGPVCESGDFLALNREMEDVVPGDLLAVHSAGAYGFTMASNYNTRPRPPEILVDGARYAVVRERERYEDLVRHESVHPEWRTA